MWCNLEKRTLSEFLSFSLARAPYQKLRIVFATFTFIIYLQWHQQLPRVTVSFFRSSSSFLFLFFVCLSVCLFVLIVWQFFSKQFSIGSILSLSLNSIFFFNLRETSYTTGQLTKMLKSVLVILTTFFLTSKATEDYRTRCRTGFT